MSPSLLKSSYYVFVQIYDWSPRPVDPDDLDLPEYADMSDQLKLRIRKSVDKNFVWLECRGRNPADRSDHVFLCMG
jgi:hypothetical protein